MPTHCITFNETYQITFKRRLIFISSFLSKGNWGKVAYTGLQQGTRLGHQNVAGMGMCLRLSLISVIFADSQGRMDWWSEQVVYSCGFLLPKFLMLPHCFEDNVKTKFSAWLLPESKRLRLLGTSFHNAGSGPWTCQALWDLASNITKYKKRWFVTSGYFEKEGPSCSVMIKDKGLEWNIFKNKKNVWKHSSEMKGLFFPPVNRKLPFAFSSSTWTVRNSSLCANERKEALTQLNVCVLHARCYRGRMQTSACDCQKNWSCSSGDALLNYSITIEQFSEQMKLRILLFPICNVLRCL